MKTFSGVILIASVGAVMVSPIMSAKQTLFAPPAPLSATDTKQDFGGAKQDRVRPSPEFARLK